jgi:glycosyltransferase involved in cell wall biosynthesis
VLLEAWGKAFPDGGARLRIVGAGELDGELRRRAASLTGVEFTGQLPREEGLRILAEARALVVPSRWYEVFPRIVAEAYALGIPVVASRLGSLAEIVRDGETGILVEPGDAGDLAQALRRLASGPDEAQQLGGQARQEYARNLAPRATVDRLLEIYAGPSAAPERTGSAPLTAGGTA